MIEFERTRDAALVRAVFSVAFPDLERDRGAEIYEHFARAHDCILIRQDGDLVGLSMVCAANDVMAEFHFAFLPAIWGQALSVPVARAWLAWFWSQTDFERLIGSIDEENRLALRFAKQLGFTVWGVNERAMRKRGILKTAVMVGLNRPARENK